MRSPVSWRDLGAGELRPEHAGERHTLAGWVARRRDHGGLVFIDLRDDDRRRPARRQPRARARGARRPRTTSATSSSCARPARSSRRAPETVNPNLPTGEVELQVDELEVVSRSTPLPFQLDEENVDETLRIRYRWLDLRRDAAAAQHPPARADGLDHPPRDGGGRLRRHRDADPLQADARGRPRLPRPVAPAARPFFALPQSPQILKQLLVIAGFERYYQIARCFRDEDLRADRVQELTQLDVEMAFPDVELILALMERMCGRSGARRSASSSRSRSSGSRTRTRCSATGRTSRICASAWRSRTRPR